jgi:hypothetical protein
MLPEELAQVQLALSCAQALSSAADSEDTSALEEALMGWEGLVAPGGWAEGLETLHALGPAGIRAGARAGAVLM